MRFISVRELKSNTSELLRLTDSGEQLIITYRGRPRAALTRLSEDELEDFIIANSPEIRKRIDEAWQQALRGETVPIEHLIAEAERELGTSAD